MDFHYIVKTNRRSKGVRISINTEGMVTVTKPSRVSNAQVEILIQKRRDWILEKIEEMKKRPKKLLAHYSAKDFKENKKMAQEIVKEKIAHFNQFYNCQIGRIIIRNQKTRWGSCSGKNNLSFNYKIVFLPAELQDYIIVHELCHIKEMNHSQKFWNLVALKVPNYKEIRRQIRLF